MPAKGDNVYPVCYHAGSLVPWEAATLHSSSLALRYALSVFEGIRLYRQSAGLSVRPFRLEEHVNRMRNSLRLMRIEEPEDFDIPRIIEDLVKANNIIEDSYVRASVSPDNSGDIGAAVHP